MTYKRKDFIIQIASGKILLSSSYQLGKVNERGGIEPLIYYCLGHIEKYDE